MNVTRFIPARAGNSARSLFAARLLTVYPRPCGEQKANTETIRRYTGLSPPVRGTG